MTDRLRSFNVDLTPRKHHGYAVLLFIFGTLFPPLGTSSSLHPAVMSQILKGLCSCRSAVWDWE